MVALMKSIDGHTKDYRFIANLRKAQITNATIKDYDDITSVLTHWMCQTSRGKTYKTNSKPKQDLAKVPQAALVPAEKKSAPDDLTTSMGGPVKRHKPW
jgi:hypothetical protein